MNDNKFIQIPNRFILNLPTSLELLSFKSCKYFDILNILQCLTKSKNLNLGGNPLLGIELKGITNKQLVIGDLKSCGSNDTCEEKLKSHPDKIGYTILGIDDDDGNEDE